MFMRDNNSAGFSRNGGKAKNSCQEDMYPGIA
jgi:hypothetical protein